MPTVEERLTELEKKVGNLDYPLNFQSKSVIENTFFNKIHALIISGGLPIFINARTESPTQGEIYVTNIASSPKVCIYIDGVEKCANLL